MAAGIAEMGGLNKMPEGMHFGPNLVSSVLVRFWIPMLFLAACSHAGASSGSEGTEPSEEIETESTESESEAGSAAEDPFARRGASTETQAARPPSPYSCTVPPLPIPRPRECARGRRYPDCKWQIPAAPLSEGRYRRWRNTIVEHMWGRPALITTLLAVADDFERIYPDQVLAIGDLDAPGPRHTTHDRGVDVDLYLLGAMMVENAGAGNYPKNYEGKSDDEVEELRQRVETLARIYATCTNGQLRIYYNDEVVLERFNAWYDAQSFPANPLGEPMVAHNDLHDFHFHITIPEDLPVHPLPEGVEHPRAEIEPPPAPETAPNLSSMNREPGGWAAVPIDRGEAPASAMNERPETAMNEDQSPQTNRQSPQTNRDETETTD